MFENRAILDKINLNIILPKSQGCYNVTMDTKDTRDRRYANAIMHFISKVFVKNLK